MKRLEVKNYPAPAMHSKRLARLPQALLDLLTTSACTAEDHTSYRNSRALTLYLQHRLLVAAATKFAGSRKVSAIRRRRRLRRSDRKNNPKSSNDRASRKTKLIQISSRNVERRKEIQYISYFMSSNPPETSQIIFVSGRKSMIQQANLVTT